MKNLRTISILTVCLVLGCMDAAAQRFEDFFSDNTLRLDYVFAGDNKKQEIYVDALSQSPKWYGRRKRLAELPLQGNGRICMKDKATGTVIYRHSFSTLFQEWLSTDEAKQTRKAFENVFLVPFPLNTVDISIELNDYHNQTTCSLTHTVDPKDILIRQKGTKDVTPYTTIQQAADTTNCIHIAYVAEGYQEAEMELFIEDAKTATEALFNHEPFKTLQDRFHIVAVRSASEQSGASIPHDGLWLNTALGSHFDTFYSDRYLTTLHLKRLHDVLAGTPYEHIIVLVNTNQYGGGGIYNSYNLSYTRGKHFRPVVVHEFGHSFAGLGDEYEYGDADPMYFSDTEPWEPNLTTKHDFSKKWGKLIEEGKASLYEGGGYLSKGVFRGSKDCRMRTNEVPEFCPVCQEAISKLIRFYTEE